MQGTAARSAVVLHAYPLWRDALTDILGDLGFRIAGTTDSAEEAVALVQREKADLLVAGVAPAVRGKDDGIECVRRARILVPGLKAVVLAPRHDDAEAERALSAGAYVYIVESTHPEDIRAAIRQGFQTSVFLGPGEMTATPPHTPRRTESEEALTKRELEILKLVAEGRSNAEVARKLWVTEQTVKFHLSNIYRKLGVANRTEAARWAQISGLLVDGPVQESAG